MQTANEFGRYIYGVIAPYLSAITSVLKNKANRKEVPLTPSIGNLANKATVSSGAITLSNEYGTQIFETNQSSLSITAPILPIDRKRTVYTVYLKSTRLGGTLLQLPAGVTTNGLVSYLLLRGYTYKIEIDVLYDSTSLSVKGDANISQHTDLL